MLDNRGDNIPPWGVPLVAIYFNSFAASIIKLDKMVDKIREGHYETVVFNRKDEIGRLSQGIHEMSGQIMRTIQGMEDDRINLSLPSINYPCLIYSKNNLSVM